jgi:hypothetical protein
MLASTGTGRSLQALVTLSFTFISDIFHFNFTVYISLATTSQALFVCDFALKSTNFLFHSFCWKLARATTALNFEHIRFLVRILLFCRWFFCTVFDPGLPSNPAHRFSIRFLPLTLFVHFILCVSYFDLQISFLFNPCLALRVFVHSFALKWLPFVALLRTSVPQLFGLHLHFPNLPP